MAKSDFLMYIMFIAVYLVSATLSFCSAMTTEQPALKINDTLTNAPKNFYICHISAENLVTTNQPTIVEFATEMINNRSDILPGHKLVISQNTVPMVSDFTKSQNVYIFFKQILMCGTTVTL